MIQSTIAARHRPQKSTIGGHFTETLATWALTIHHERRHGRRFSQEGNRRYAQAVGLVDHLHPH